MPRRSKRKSKSTFSASPQILRCSVLLKNKNIPKLVDMAVDTGASVTMISYRTAIGIGIDPKKSKEHEEIITANGLIYAALIEIPFVSALGIEQKNFKVLCHDLPAQSKVEGLLGVDFLSHFPPYQTFGHHVQKYSLQFWKS